MHQEMRDLLELAGLRDIKDIIAPIMQIVAGSPGPCRAPCCRRSRRKAQPIFWARLDAGHVSLLDGASRKCRARVSPQ